MRIAITGATGFIGTRARALLAAAGHEVVPLVRRPSGLPGAVAWDPAGGRIDAAGLEGLDVVLNLAGENLSGLWTAAKKQRIVDSRVRGTALLAETLAGLRRPPALLVSASAVGHYGAHPPEEEVDESTPAGSGFLATVTRAWEAAATPAMRSGIRVVHPRFGLVIGRGGALQAMLPIFRLGLGGPIGSGRQIVSWIALDEIVPALLHVVATPALAGAVDFTSPEPVSFAELAAALGRVLRRPAAFRLPGFAARLALGEMAEEMLLTGARVVPRRLLETGYRFRFPGIDGALAHALEGGG